MATPTISLTLEHHRRKAGVSLEQISEQTKIGTNYLRAIESEEFEKLPGGVFNTGYIRQYAAAIGFSADQILTFYREKMEPLETPDPSPEVKVTASGLRAYMSWLPRPLFR